MFEKLLDFYRHLSGHYRSKSIERSIIRKRSVNRIIFAGVVVVIVVTVSVFIFIYTQFKEIKRITVEDRNHQEKHFLINENQPEKEELLVHRLIDGVMVKEGDENIRPVAVMIDNFIDARPLSGVSHAELVFEAPVEAGITRFLAIYAHESDSVIGPIRSARPYFVDWAEEFGAVYAHVGGSEAGLSAARSASVVNVDDIYGQDYYWRDYSRHAPHNVYTTTEKLLKYAERLGFDKKRNFDSWNYREDGDVDPYIGFPEIKSISIDFRVGTNMVSWKYDNEANEYVRYELGSVFRDSDGSEIKAKNIVLAHMKMWILDEVGRRSFQTIGSGDADIFLEGKHIIGRWEKKSGKERMRFFDKKGTEIAFIPGTTWIEIVPTWGVDYRFE